MSVPILKRITCFYMTFHLVSSICEAAPLYMIQAGSSDITSSIKNLGQQPMSSKGDLPKSTIFKEIKESVKEYFKSGEYLDLLTRKRFSFNIENTIAIDSNPKFIIENPIPDIIDDLFVGGSYKFYSGSGSDGKISFDFNRSNYFNFPDQNYFFLNADLPFAKYFKWVRLRIIRSTSLEGDDLGDFLATEKITTDFTIRSKWGRLKTSYSNSRTHATRQEFNYLDGYSYSTGLAYSLAKENFYLNLSFNYGSEKLNDSDFISDSNTHYRTTLVMAKRVRNYNFELSGTYKNSRYEVDISENLARWDDLYQIFLEAESPQPFGFTYWDTDFDFFLFGGFSHSINFSNFNGVGTLVNHSYTRSMMSVGLRLYL